MGLGGGKGGEWVMRGGEELERLGVFLPHILGNMDSMTKTLSRLYY